MYPTLYHLFKDLFGVEWVFLKPVNSFGFCVAMAFLVAAIIYKKEIQRREKAGLISGHKKMVMEGEGASPVEVAINTVIGFIIGFKLLYPFGDSAVLDDFQHYITSSKGSWIGGVVFGLALGGYNFYRNNKNKLPEPKEVEKEIKPHEHIPVITFIALIGGFAGAKLFAWFEDPQPFWEFISDPFSGLTIYGGLITAFVACYIYVRKHKLSAGHFMDGVAPSLILAYGIGRLGCHMSGDGDWGIENPSPKPDWMSFLPDWLWSYNYPNNVIDEGVLMPDCIYDDYCYQLAVPVYPTPLYEIMMCLIIFGILWYLRKRIHVTGMLFFIYLIFNGIERFLIELIRVNVPYNIGGLEITQAQLISSALIITGVVGTILLKKGKIKIP